MPPAARAARRRPWKRIASGHDGQIIAIVVAETFEAAREAAHRVGVAYVADTPSASFDSPDVKIDAASAVEKKHEDPQVGNVEGRFLSG